MPDNLDPAQVSAVEATEGPVIIAAGHGTGETRAFAHRVAHLIHDRRLPPDRSVFTRNPTGCYTRTP